MHNVVITVISVFVATLAIYSKPRAILDSVTWSDYRGKMNWIDASLECSNIGMRLPSISEWKTAHTKKQADSWKKDQLWEKSDDVWYWTSDEFREGLVGYVFDIYAGHDTFAEGGGDAHVRCMKDLTKPDTKLHAEKIAKFRSYAKVVMPRGIWGNVLGKMKWADASMKCSKQKMRLPTIDEIVAAYKSNSTIDWPDDYYWTSEGSVTNSQYVSVVYLGTIGISRYGEKGFSSYRNISGYGDKVYSRYNARCIQ